VSQRIGKGPWNGGPLSAIFEGGIRSQVVVELFQRQAKKRSTSFSKLKREESATAVGLAIVKPIQEGSPMWARICSGVLGSTGVLLGVELRERREALPASIGELARVWRRRLAAGIT